MSISTLRPLVPLWAAAAVRRIEGAPDLFEKAWEFVTERSFSKTLAAAREALAAGNLFRKGNGARYPEDLACGGDGVEADAAEEEVADILCEDAEDEEE